MLFTLKSSCHKKRHVKRKVYIRKPSDDEPIKLELKTLAAKLSTQYDKNSVEAKWNDFENSVHNIMDSCIPHKDDKFEMQLTLVQSLTSTTIQGETIIYLLFIYSPRQYNKAKKTGSVHHWHKFFAARKRMH